MCQILRKMVYLSGNIKSRQSIIFGNKSRQSIIFGNKSRQSIIFGNKSRQFIIFGNKSRQSIILRNITRSPLLLEMKLDCQLFLLHVLYTCIWIVADPTSWTPLHTTFVL